MAYLANFLIVLLNFVSIIMIGIILLQRGRGGGLAGALGGSGGQSVFGSKAGDLFTRITVGIAIVWFILASVIVVLASQRLYTEDPEKVRPAATAIGEPATKPADPETPASATTTPAATTPAAATPAAATPEAATPAEPKPPAAATETPAAAPEKTEEPKDQPAEPAPAAGEAPTAKADETKPADAPAQP